jgi:hypothetical protein
MPSPRIAGLLLLLTALATAIMVPTRLMADADQPTLQATLEAISDNNPAYIYSAIARIAAGLLLVAAAVFLKGVVAPYHPTAARLTVIALAVSGVITVASGAMAMTLAAIGPAAIAAQDAEALRRAEVVDAARWITGKAGFTLAGLGLIALGPAQWRIGGLLKVSAVAHVIIGVVMLFIWIDAATVMHRISGMAFLLWLIVTGVWLAAGLLKRPEPAVDETDPIHQTGAYEYGRPRN